MQDMKLQDLKMTD